MTIEILDSKVARQLEAELQAIREGGVAIALCRHSTPQRNPEAAVAIIKGFSKALFDMSPNMTTLHPLQDRPTAEERSAFWLSTGLAYGDEAMNRGLARRFARRFLDLFEDPEYYTNVNPSGNSWSPVSRNTFDAALLVVDRDIAGILCVIDED